ncbi:MAG: hypothetical protein CL609_21925 [Anaerolineaceae bacterium]|nr:hypothetical protein [Anaerolineaceae bacterium]
MKYFLQRLVVFCLVLILSGCSNPNQTDEKIDTTIDDSQQKKLVVWTHEFPSFNEGIQKKWIPEFEASHPSVTIEYVTIPYSGEVVSFDTRLLAEVSSGGGPDIWAMASFNFTEEKYIEAGLLAPLDPAIFGYASVDDLLNDYPPNSLSVFVRDGKIYGLLNELTTLCLFYNLDVFDEVGIPYLDSEKPTSWQEIARIGEQITQRDEITDEPSRLGYQFGFFANYPSPQWYIQNFYPILRQYGQNDIYINVKPSVETEAFYNSLQLFYDFTHTYRIYDPYFIKDWFADFSNNRTAMVTAGPWFPSALQPETRFGVAPHPVVNPDDPETYQNIMYSFGWVVNANLDDEKSQLAQEFLAFMLGKKGEAEQPLWWFENVGILQPRTAFLQSPEYETIINRDSWMKCFIDTFDTYEVDYYQHSSDKPGMALIRAIDRVVYNEISPKDSAELLQNELLLLP